MAKSESPRVLREYWEQPPERLAQDNITVTSSDVLEDPRLEKHLHELVPANLVQPHRLRWAQAAFPSQEESRRRDERALLRHEERAKAKPASSPPRDEGAPLGRESAKLVRSYKRSQLYAAYALAKRNEDGPMAALLQQEILGRAFLAGQRHLKREGR